MMMRKIKKMLIICKGQELGETELRDKFRGLAMINPFAELSEIRRY